MVDSLPTELPPAQLTSRQGAPLPLVLASGSPRRHELLTALGASFTIIVTDAEDEETAPPAPVAAALLPLPLPLYDHPTLRAWRKATAAHARAPEAVVLGADTVVAFGDTVLNKPVDAAHAQELLASLSGNTHMVYTGLCVLRGEQTWLDLVATEVEFLPLSPETIAAYISTGEPFDKAGAYGVQGRASALVRAVRGSYTAVVGLPLHATHRLLTAAGVAGLHDPATTYQRWLASQGKEPLPCPPSLP